MSSSPRTTFTPSSKSSPMKASSVWAASTPARRSSRAPSGCFGRRDAATDELLIRTARDTVGPSVELMVDAGGSEQFWPHGYKWALQTAKMLANYDVVWFEEALPPDDLEGFIELRRHAPLPIATGEVLTRRQSFRPFLERHAVDIGQPDCTKFGGISESIRLA